MYIEQPVLYLLTYSVRYSSSRPSKCKGKDDVHLMKPYTHVETSICKLNSRADERSSQIQAWMLMGLNPRPNHN